MGEGRPVTPALGPNVRLMSAGVEKEGGGTRLGNPCQNWEKESPKRRSKKGAKQTGGTLYKFAWWYFVREICGYLKTSEAVKGKGRAESGIGKACRVLRKNAERLGGNTATYKRGQRGLSGKKLPYKCGPKKTERGTSGNHERQKQG